MTIARNLRAERRCRRRSRAKPERLASVSPVVSCGTTPPAKQEVVVCVVSTHSAPIEHRRISPLCLASPSPEVMPHETTSFDLHHPLALRARIAARNLLRVFERTRALSCDPRERSTSRRHFTSRERSRVPSRAASPAKRDARCPRRRLAPLLHPHQVNARTRAQSRAVSALRRRVRDLSP